MSDPEAGLNDRFAIPTSRRCGSTAATSTAAAGSCSRSAAGSTRWSGQLLEIRSTEPSVAEDLPAWCRMTGNELVSTWHDRERGSWSFLVSKSRFDPAVAQAGSRLRERRSASCRGNRNSPVTNRRGQARGQVRGGAAGHRSALGHGHRELAPRPTGCYGRSHERLEGRLDEAEFQALADRAVAEIIQAQLEAGVDVVTDGEQRRDSYASFVGSRLENCQLIPIVDLLPYVEHPEEFARELQALDVPAESVRHPAVFGRI